MISSNNVTPKRILIFSLAYTPFMGGAEVAVSEISNRINPGAIEFEMITLRFDKTLPRTEKIGNILVHRIGFATNKPTARDMVRFPLYLNKIAYPVIACLKAISLYKKKEI